KVLHFLIEQPMLAEIRYPMPLSCVITVSAATIKPLRCVANDKAAGACYLQLPVKACLRAKLLSRVSKILLGNCNSSSMPDCSPRPRLRDNPCLNSGLAAHCNQAEFTIKILTVVYAMRERNLMFVAG
ncbi:hypothetical protein NP590_20295, partial [Methylomonas sp. SURF-2]